ncbi:2Fe-2S ferredoxin [Marinicauda salina]|uniref:2Fe-2S ferredoxin n=1 Tax=Marinicauda salina TaxID=2135793 RepID=A0A2U2BXU7_9PROT|nr:aromatic ring-hydroxylating dioxygenase subunit alpha [Marinicauda salina]PWE18832.1 2Fe-2S ferredoxin [Marinicauda salina]
MTEETSFLSHLWYLGAPSRRLKPGAMLRKVIMGQPILLARDSEGKAFAIRDICPHRGIPLSEGRLLEDESGAVEIECAYHGWRFGREGRCKAIPSLVEGQQVDLSKICVRRYPVREHQGLVWVFVCDTPVEGPAMAEAEPVEPPFPPPDIPGVGERRPNYVHVVEFACHVDNAIIGLMDPAHGPYVHQSWYWRSSGNMYEKEKRFAPVERGFSMVNHPPSSNSLAYRVLGGKPTTEIAFRLPGVRTEHVRVGERFVTSLTVVTPIDHERTEVTQVLYWDHPVLTALKPLLGVFARAFLDQDRVIVQKQYEGLKFNPRLMLINDADVQAKWYFRMKKAWTRSVETGAEFVHPLQDEVTLRWRS